MRCAIKGLDLELIQLDILKCTDLRDVNQEVLCNWLID